MRIIGLIRRSLDTVISPMVYVMTTVSIIVGFSHAFLASTAGVQGTILARFGVFLSFTSVNVWAILLMLGAIATLYGLIRKQKIPTEYGSMVCFLMWAFASLTYLTNGFYFIFITWALFHLIFYGYVYLTSSLGIITRVAVRKLEDEDGEI